MRAGKRKNHGQTQARMAPEGRTHTGAAVTMPAPRAEAAAGVDAAVLEQPPVAPLPRTKPQGLCPPPLIVPQQTRPLDEQWATWILDNSLRRCTPGA